MYKIYLWISKARDNYSFNKLSSHRDTVGYYHVFNSTNVILLLSLTIKVGKNINSNISQNINAARINHNFNQLELGTTNSYIVPQLLQSH